MLLPLPTVSDAPHSKDSLCSPLQRIKLIFPRVRGSCLASENWGRDLGALSNKLSAKLPYVSLPFTPRGTSSHQFVSLLWAR